MTIDMALTGEDWRTDNIPMPAPTPTADELIASEVARQNAMWGPENERADATQGQLLEAGMAQLEATYAEDFSEVPFIYPDDWSGFRDYGTPIANLVVAAAFIRQEIARRLRLGEDYTRKSRNTATQPYGTDQPAVNLP